MILEKVRMFYLLVKNHFIREKFKLFFDYFEKTWLNLEDNDDVKFNFDVWSYYNKFDFKTSKKIKTLISEKLLEEYIFITNNCYESF